MSVLLFSDSVSATSLSRPFSPDRRSVYAEGLSRYLYVDGAEVAKDTDFVGGVGSDGGLYFGAGKTLDAGSFFSGLIDDIRIYNVALSAEEVAELAR